MKVDLHNIMAWLPSTVVFQITSDHVTFTQIDTLTYPDEPCFLISKTFCIYCPAFMHHLETCAGELNASLPCHPFICSTSALAKAL